MQRTVQIFISKELFALQNATFSTVENTNQTIARYTAKTYLWMFLGLALTFALSFLLIQTGFAYQILMRYTAIAFVLLIAEVIIVIALAARIQKLSTGVATFLFFLYAALNGITFSAIFLIYDATAAILIFGVTAVIFGIMGAWGYFTKQDLSRWSRVLFFGVLGLGLFWLLRLFLPLSGLETIISLIGIAIFLGFTAYDTQKIKAYYHFYADDPAMLKKASIFSALQLYLDFINLFLYLLRLFGKK